MSAGEQIHSECVKQPRWTFQQLLQAAPHHVDVLNAHKLEANVGVVVLILVAFARRSVGERIQLQESGEIKRHRVFKGDTQPFQVQFGSWVMKCCLLK